MKLQPIYSPENVPSPAYHLRYTWSGWPSSSSFPDIPSEEFFRQLDHSWENDGMRRLEMSWSDSRIQFTFSVKPQVSPVFFTSRVKGRLQHALRESKLPRKFSRKVAFRAIGENCTAEVEAYIKRQVDKEAFVEPEFAEFFRQFTVTDPEVRLDQPTQTNSGRYWYNLHLVLVVDHRRRFTDLESLKTIDRWCSGIAGKKGYAVSTRSVMPDHLHLALRGNIEESPEEIALALMNNLAYALGQNPIWRPSYYVGTSMLVFGCYLSVRTPCNCLVALALHCLSP
jgi:REP element-mobilizing transposase RayT